MGANVIWRPPRGQVDLPEGISEEFAASSFMGPIMTHGTLLPALTGKEPEDQAGSCGRSGRSAGP